MATVLDRLVVELGLDPKAFVKGQGETTKSLSKTREAAVKHGTGIEKSMDGAAEAVDKLARNALKLFAIFTAGRAIGAFTADITAADAALGRLAKSVGSTPEVISSLSNAVSRNGGSASAAAGSFERLADSINEIKTTGNSSILPYLYRLQGLGGKQINLNKEMSETFGDLAENAKNIADKQGIPFATYLLKQAGVDRDTAALLVQGRQAYNKALAESRKIGIVRKEDTEAAQKLQTVMEELRQTSEGFGRTVLTALTPTISDLIERMRQWITANQDWIKTEIVEKVRQFAEWLKSIDWDGVGKGLRDFGNGALKVAEQFGGVLKICEALFAFWVGSKAIAIVGSILRVAGLLGGGPLGWAIKLAMAGAVAMGSVDPSKSIVHGGVPSGQQNPGDELPGVNSDENRRGRGGIFARARRAVVNRARRLRGGGEGGDANYNFTGDNANVVKQAAAELGTSPKDLATVISYETGGKFDPSIKGGKGGNYTGLIQFGPAERAKYGVTGKETFAEQMPKVVQFLKDRGFKPGMSLNQLYATINGGNPYVSQNASDGNGTIAQHVERMRSGHAARVERFLNSGDPASAATSGNGSSNKTAASATSNPDGSPLPTDGKGVNNDLMRVIKRAQEISAIKFHIHEGLRTIERQKEMVERGWSKTYNSKHLTGRAVDLRADGDPAVGDLDSAKYAKINEAMKKAAAELGVPVQWGGDSFGKFKDVPHFQLPDSFKSEAGAYGGDQAKVSALQAQRAGAQSAIAQANAAQAATVSSTSNDNRSTSTSETSIGQINIHTAATDASGIARDIGPQMKRHAFAAAANYARA